MKPALHLFWKPISGLHWGHAWPIGQLSLHSCSDVQLQRWRLWYLCEIKWLSLSGSQFQMSSLNSIHVQHQILLHLRKMRKIQVWTVFSCLHPCEVRPPHDLSTGNFIFLQQKLFIFLTRKLMRLFRTNCFVDDTVCRAPPLDRKWNISFEFPTKLVKLNCGPRWRIQTLEFGWNEFLKKLILCSEN